MQPATRPHTLDPANLDALATWLAGVLEARSVRFGGASLLSGGAIQENWRLVADVEGGPRQGRHDWVLRTDAVARLTMSLDRTGEFGVLKAAHAAGVAIAEPIASCADPAIVGAPFLLQTYVPGDAQARRIVRDPALEDYGDALTERLGAELARIHGITPPREELAFLPIPLLPPGRNEVARLRGALDAATEPRPALEYVLSWLDAHAPEPEPVSLVHGDYRTGNYLVQDRRLGAILDWEFAHWGDRHEDIGWFMARCWRFGGDAREAGGIGNREAFYRGYRSAAALPMDEAVVPYWEIMAAAKWATVAALQGDRYRAGGECSIELALTGLMPPEMELDALDGIAALAASGDARWQ
ncbi:MAG: phosphotransferase family protein [Hyphomicrobiaceae bacterium]|nr:phosphotransferase family protein [Hyphomicrobiaceae bacterium]